MIKLSTRLQRIFDMIPACHTFCDIGCDHGYLTMAVLEAHKAHTAIAMDVNKGPLETARTNINKAGLLASCDLRLSSGFDKLSVDEADCTCICGMGGLLIKKIIEAGFEKACHCKTLIIEPQSEYATLRAYLSAQGFVIDDEDLVTEEGKVYPVIKLHFESDQDKRQALSDHELYYGPIILKNKPELLYKLLDKNQAEYERILASLSSKDVQADSPIAKRIEELSCQLEIIKDIRG